MTSEPDSTSRRRPPTIDLTAREVETEKLAADPPGDGEKDAPGGQTRRRFRLQATGDLLTGTMGAGAGAAAVLAIFAALWLAGLVPSRGAAPPPNAGRSEAAAIKEISARLDKTEAALAAQRPDAGLTARIAAAEAGTKSLGDSLAALNRRVDDIAATVRSALAHADAAAAAVDAAKTAAQAGIRRDDLDALANRLTALEGSVKSLNDDVSRHASGVDDRAARMTVAAEALRAAVERGAPYQSELAAVTSLGVDQNALAPLDPFAADGVPSATVLAREVMALTPALVRASGTAPGASSFLGRLKANAQKIVRVTPIDAPLGDDPAAVIARINAAAARGDLAAARAEIAKLPAPARALADGWVKKAEAREAAIAASRRVAADTLAALGKPASQ